MPSVSEWGGGMSAVSTEGHYCSFCFGGVTVGCRTYDQKNREVVHGFDSR